MALNPRRYIAGLWQNLSFGKERDALGELADKLARLALDVAATPAPAGVPSGTLIHFDGTACPTGWSELTAARNKFLRGWPGSGSAGAAGGSDTHSHGNTGLNSLGTSVLQGTGGSVTVAHPTHDHTISTGASVPAYLAYIICRKD